MQTGTVKWVGEQKFVATSPSGHAMTIDSDRASNKAPGPMELVLLALGACTATDIVIILAALGARFLLLGPGAMRTTTSQDLSARTA